MKKGAIDWERAIVTHYQATEVAEPGVGAFDDPTPLVPPQCPAILGCWPNAIFLVRADQFDAARPQAFSQRIAVVGFVSDHPHRFLPWPAGVMTPPYPDGRERRFRKPDVRRGCRVKESPKGTPRPSTTTIHFVPLPRLVSFNSLRNARQTFSQTPCSSQSRNRRQQVEGCGYFTGKSCPLAPLRRIQRIPSSTRRFSIHGRPPCDSCAVSNGPDRAIGPPSALLTLLIAHSGKLNHPSFKHLYRVMQQLLASLPVVLGFHRLSAWQLQPPYSPYSSLVVGEKPSCYRAGADAVPPSFRRSRKDSAIKGVVIFNAILFLE
jgi:hypothetical protein